MPRIITFNKSIYIKVTINQKSVRMPTTPNYGFISMYVKTRDPVTKTRTGHKWKDGKDGNGSVSNASPPTSPEIAGEKRRCATGRCTGVIIIPTQTMYCYKGNPSRLPYISIFWLHQNGWHLMTTGVSVCFFQVFTFFPPKAAFGLKGGFGWTPRHALLARLATMRRNLRTQ